MPIHQAGSKSAFQSLDFDSSSSGDSYDSPETMPTIFRYMEEGEEEASIQASAFLKRANPINEHRDEEMSEACRPISPYLFMPTLRDDTETLARDADDEPCRLDFQIEDVPVDYSRFFVGQETRSVMECDDFSISSNSISDDLCLEEVSNNPSSFWEEGIDVVASAERTWSPAQVSLESDSAPVSPDPASPQPTQL